MRASFLALLSVSFLSCGGPHVTPPPPSGTPTAVPIEDDAAALRIAEELMRACPISTAVSPSARETCASGLVASDLQSRMSEPFLWGAEQEDTRGLDAARTTRFNALVWLKMYLSLEAFTGVYRIEHDGDRTILRMATRFRGDLDPGDYPYPFWHSAAKWESYQRARETLFIIEQGKLIAALRSAEQDPTRPTTPQRFTGDWQLEYRPATLFQRLFSNGNSRVAALDHAYRAFEAESRQYNCTTCHRPDNVAGQQQLEMLCYPNQALASRHTIVRAIEERRMPPASPGRSSGIADDEQRARLLELARTFEQAAEAALVEERASASSGN